jgi:hypothetical protein
MLGYGQHVEAIDPRLAYTILGRYVTVGVDGVAVEVALQNLVTIDLRQYELITQHLLADGVAQHIDIALVLIVE